MELCSLVCSSILQSIHLSVRPVFSQYDKLILQIAVAVFSLKSFLFMYQLQGFGTAAVLLYFLTI